MDESKFLLYRIDDLQLMVRTCRYAARGYDTLAVCCIHSGESEEL